MQLSTDVLIIGSGMAAYTLAKAYRQLATGEVTIITQDAGAAYSKPRLSTLCATVEQPSDLITAQAEELSQQLGIKILTNCQVLSLDRINSQVKFQQKLTNLSGTSSYKKLVLACGAQPKTWELANKLSPTCQQKIFSINSLNDYCKLDNYLQQGGERQKESANKQGDDQRQGGAKQPSKVLIIGSGLIACELAHDLLNPKRKLNYPIQELCIASPATAPLSSLVPADLGPDFIAPFTETLSSYGVKWCLGATIEQLIALAEAADLIITAIGLAPNISLAQQAGLATDKGIIVNEYLQTNDPNIYALGDCMQYQGKLWQYVAPINTAAPVLAAHLAEQELVTGLKFPVMPVNVKTSGCLVCSYLPFSYTQDLDKFNWQLVEPGQARLYLNEHLVGFVLIGEQCKHKFTLASKALNHHDLSQHLQIINA